MIVETTEFLEVVLVHFLEQQELFQLVQQELRCLLGIQQQLHMVLEQHKVMQFHKVNSKSSLLGFCTF